MIIGADSLSGTKRVMHNAFASTFLPVSPPTLCDIETDGQMLGQSCLIVVYCLSLIVRHPGPFYDSCWH